LLGQKLQAGGCGEGGKAKGAKCGVAFGTDHRASAEHRQLIGEARADQGGGKGGTAFAQNPGQAACGKLARRVVQIDVLAGAGGAGDQARPGGSPGGAGLADELVLFSAGVLIGSDGHPALGPLHLASLAEAPRLRRLSLESIGPDTISRWRCA